MKKVFSLIICSLLLIPSLAMAHGGHKKGGRRGLKGPVSPGPISPGPGFDKQNSPKRPIPPRLLVVEETDDTDETDNAGNTSNSDKANKTDEAEKTEQSKQE